MRDEAPLSSPCKGCTDVHCHISPSGGSPLGQRSVARPETKSYLRRTASGNICSTRLYTPPPCDIHTTTTRSLRKSRHAEIWGREKPRAHKREGGRDTPAVPILSILTRRPTLPTKSTTKSTPRTKAKAGRRGGDIATTRPRGEPRVRCRAGGVPECECPLRAGGACARRRSTAASAFPPLTSPHPNPTPPTPTPTSQSAPSAAQSASSRTHRIHDHGPKLAARPPRSAPSPPQLRQRRPPQHCRPSTPAARPTTAAISPADRTTASPALVNQ